LALVERVLAECGVDAVVIRTDVSDPADVDVLRFLGSPSIRVDGRDVEPDAGGGRPYSYSCRTYPTEGGRTGVPDERWIRAALVAAPAGGR
jgi:hypothetical protein